MPFNRFDNHSSRCLKNNWFGFHRFGSNYCHSRDDKYHNYRSGNGCRGCGRR